jgi:Domain of unknown function (DUF3244)
MNSFHKIYALAVLVLTFATQSVFASNGENDQKIKASEKFAYSLYATQKGLHLRLNFDNEEGQKVKVRLFDPQGHLIHQESLTNKHLRRDYNLEDAGKGHYKVQIITEDETFDKELNVGIKTNSQAFQAYMSPELADGQVRLSFQNASEAVYIRILDAEGSILYSEVAESNDGYARKFDLSHLQKGTYSLELSCGEKTIEHVYTVK